MRIILADDAVLIREGLAGLLASQGHEVVAQFSDAPSLTEALTTGPDCAADLLITDVRMPPGMADDGLSAALEVRAAQPHLPILVLSQYVAPRLRAHPVFLPQRGRNRLPAQRARHRRARVLILGGHGRRRRGGH